MLSSAPRVAAVARTHDTRRKNAAPSRAAHRFTYIFGVPRAFFVLGISAMLSLFAHADVRSLVNDGKVTWSSNATVIYLNADGTPATAAAYDHLVLKFTDPTAAGSFTIADGVKGAARVLLVGGGGAGGSGGGTGNNRGAGGGGGAGGFLEVPTVPLESDTTYSITVGAGGEPQLAESKLPGGNGASSLFQLGATTLYEAFGGGGGGAECDGIGGDNLGSGGGGSREYVSSSVSHVGGVCTTGQGNNGGAGTRGQTAGGGGGAGEAGLDGGDNGVATPAVNIGGKGGDGRSSDIICTNGVSSVLPLYYAGGGGGGTRSQTTEEKLGPGGLGGGGRGAGGNDFVALPGEPNTGGGGGGGTCTLTVSGENKSKAGAAGGSGIVIVRITQLVETQVALPTINPIAFDQNYHVALDFGIAYTYVDDVNSVTNARDVGNYSFKVKPGPGLEWNEAAGYGTDAKTINWSITKRLLNKPEAVTNLVYDGTNKIGVTHDEELTKYCTFDASSVTNAINAGDYTYSVSLKEPANTAWNDNTTDDVDGSWAIAPQTVAVPTPKTDLVYDGNEKQGFDSLDYEHYELTSGVTNATAGGAHQFTFSLLGNGSAVNYVWDTDPVSSEPYSGEWTIAAAENSVTPPVLEGWRLGTTPNVPTATALYGDVRYVYGLGESEADITEWISDATAINVEGVWTVKAIVDPSANWNGASNSSQFTVWDDPVKLFRDHVDIRVTPPAGSSETFINFAALVKISEDRFYGFEYARAGSDGNKLMFLDSNKNTLPFEVDTWRTKGESLVWVLIPELPPAGTTITMYWNLKEGRTPPPNNPEEVWPFYSGVWHMNESITSAQEAATAPSYDSTANKNNATPTKGANGNLGQMISTTGFIGNARVNSSANPQTQGNRLQTDRPQTFNGVFTFSGWFKMTAKNSYPRLAGAKLSTIDGKGWSVETAQNSSTSLYVRGNGNSAFSDVNVNDLLSWVYLTFVYNNTTASVYSNGKFIKSGTITKVEDTTQPLVFGGQGAPSTGNNEYSFYGAYDEIRITGQALSAQRIAAEYATVVSNDFTVQGSAVSRDDVKRNYWVTLPSMDKTDWDITETPGVITNGGALAFCGVTNYIYSVYDPTRIFASTTDLTEVGYYRIVFLPDDSEGYEPISHTIEVHVVEGQPYTDIGGNGGDSGRVLLMNNHTKDPNALDIDYQGWYDADNTEQIDGRKAFAGKSDTVTFWHHLNLAAPSATSYNLKHGTISALYTKNYGSRLWHLDNCRHGNTFPTKDTDPLVDTQNYLSWKATYSRRINAHNTLPGSRSTTGQLVMQNTTDAAVYSSCFTNGIGTIYFDTVNGWCRPDEDYENYKLVVEIATNTVEGLVPTDINSVTYTIEKDPDTEEVTAIITNWYGNLENCWHAVPVIPYKRDGTANFEKGVKTEELTLDVANGGTMDNFFRVVVPLDIAGPVRFRIRRATADAGRPVDVSSFILLDNIIVSIPAMSADLVSAGHYDEEKSGSQTLGWELATSVPYPSVDDTANLITYAKPEFTLNVGDGSTPETNKFFSSATMHYRWRYLNQTLDQEVSAWKNVALNPSDDFKAIGPLDLPRRPGDVEYWFEYRLQAPYYKYVDYSGASNAAIDYTEERGVLTNKLNDSSIASGGSDWYFRIREGKSDYSGLDIVFRRGTSETAERVHMSLAEDHVWRGFVQTREDQPGTIKYRIEALGRQTAEFAEYAAITNYWRCRIDNPSFPVSDSLEPGTVDSWSTLTLDAVTGYVMFQIDDSSLDSLALTVVHADYQDANGWSDALGRRDSLGRGPIFVGTSTTNAYKVGVSPTKQTFADDFSGWGDMAVTTSSWTFVTGLTDIKSNHMYGRKTYETFASDTNGLWEVGQGQWIAKKYRDDRDNAGVALQMEGYGKGYLQFTDAAKAPRGLESITFNARLTQYIRFEDFAYYFGGDENILNLQNYTFVARTAFDLNANKNFTGNASLSVVANYLPNKGCYEARWEWLGNNATAQRGQRLCLYRWNVTSSGTKEPELIIARTNTTFNVEELTALANNSNQRFTPLFISVSNDAPNKCTYVVAGIRRCGVALGTNPIGTSALNTSNGRNANWFGVCFKDTDQSKRLAKGSYGVLSANCPGVFARPEFSHTTQVTVGQFPGNGKLRDSFDSSSLSQVSNLQNIRNCVYEDLRDSEYPGWNIIPGRNSVTFTDNDVNAVIGSAPPQELLLYIGTAGRGDWGSTPYKRITVDGFGGATETVSLYTTKDCSVRLAVGSSSSDVAVDTVQLKQWRGGDWNGEDIKAEKIAPSWTTGGSGKFAPVFTNFIFTSCWTKNNDILMSAKRSNLETPCAIRSPLMDYMANDGRGGDGYHRGIGLGMISVGYKDAQPNASLLLQIATNAVDYTMVDTFDGSFSDSYWTTITNYNFATMTEAQRTSGVLNTYLGLHSVTGMMRIVVNTNVINAVANVTDTTRFGDVTITSISCNDEPPVDVHSWWGWNLRTVGGDRDSEKMMLLDDFATAPGAAGLSLALNNSVDADYNISKIDVSDRESYIQHKPFVQTPTFTSNVVGEVSFKARKYASSDEPATVVLFGSKDASETDDGTWEKIGAAVFTVTNDWYETYSYKTDPGQSYKAFRLAVVGILGIQEDVSGGGNARIPGAADPPVRVLLDELFVSEAVRARMGFRNVGCFKSDMAGTDAVPNVPSTTEQPLCGEAWGVQCEIYGAQLASDIDFEHTPQVRLHWFDQGVGGTVEGGVSPWGYDKWKGSSGHKSALLSPATDSSEGHYVYRSSQRTSPAAVIGASMGPPKYVQYTLEVIYYTKGSTVPTTNWLSTTDWEIPSWYRPLDLNSSFGKGSSFAAYNILDNVAPGWAWINEVNVFGLFDDALQNTDADCQYVEIVQPPEADISGWSVRILDAQIDNKLVATNTLATFGMGDLAGVKDAKWIDPTANKVFRVIANQQARDTGLLKYEDGTLDGVWHLENINLTNMSGDSLGNTEITAYRPFAIQLVRSSGIVEHEIVAMGTNWWWDLPEFLARYHPTNSVNFLNANMAGSDFFYVGMDDDGGEPKSLGVFQNNGSVTNDWNNTMDKTPGSINKGNGIVQTIGDHPRPNPVNILVYMTVDGSHILHSLDGGTTFTNEMFMLSVPKGSLHGTNVTYRVDPWYVVGSVTTNGTSAMGALTPTVTTQPRQYVLSGVGKGASNNVTVVAMAALDPRIVDLGIDDNNPYRDAIIDWFEGGTDIYGNPFADVDAGEIKLAQYCKMNGEYVRDMTLTEMYWLDLDPTAGDLALLGGMASVEPIQVPKLDGSGMQENVRMDVYMMFTNRNATLPAPAEHQWRGPNDKYTHWTPYVLRGLDPKSSSLDYDDAAGDWASETFKITARLLNSYTQEGNVANQAPMRLFVFKPDSFTAEGISKVEIEDPSSYPPFVEWWKEYGPCGIVYFWSLDERKRPKGVEILKQENYYVH